MGVPRAFRADNGAENTNSTFVDFCNSLGIRRELTTPYTLQQNSPVESGLSRAIKVGHAARVEVNKLFSDIHLKRLKEVQDPDGSSLWMESVMSASEGFYGSTRTANSGMLSPHEVFYGDHPPMPVLPFCKPAYHRVPRRRKMDPLARPCLFLNFGYNNGSKCFKIMNAETEMALHSRDVTWHELWESLTSPAPTVGSGVSNSSSGAETPDYVYIQPSPVATATPATAPAPAPATAVPVPALAPPPVFAPAAAPPMNPPTPIPNRAVGELGHDADVRLPGRTRGGTRIIRDSHHSTGLMSMPNHAWLAQILANHEAFDEALREHGSARSHN